MAKKSAKGRDREATLDKIFKETVKLVQQIGFDGIRSDELARLCGISRPLLNHYFPNDQKFELRAFVTKRVLESFKNYIDLSLQKISHPDRMLTEYIKCHFRWGREYPGYVCVHLDYLSRCAIQGDLLGINTESVQAGHQRIEMFLHDRISDRKNVAILARSFQLFLTGALISSFTEDPSRNRKGLDPEALTCKYLEALLEKT